MNFNYWKDYLNLKDVFFSSLHKNNNSSLFTEIHSREPYKLKEQYKSLEKHLIYASATPKERIKTQINNKLRSENEESFVKQKKISENGRINDQEEKIENSNSSINLKQNYFTDQDNIETLKESVKNEIYSLKLKMDLLKAAMSTELINTKTSQKTEKIENLKLGRENPKDNEVTKNSETEKEQNTFLPCFFCRKNGEQKSFYMSHTLKTNDGLVQCPILQKYVCPKCNATGQNAHTLLYCPLNKNDYQSTSLTHLTPRMSSGKKRNNFRTI